MNMILFKIYLKHVLSATANMATFHAFAFQDLPFLVWEPKISQNCLLAVIWAVELTHIGISSPTCKGLVFER